MLRIVLSDLWPRELEFTLSIVEKVGGHGDVLYKENAQSAMDGEKDEPRIDAYSG